MPRSKSASQLPKLQVYKRVDEGVGGGCGLGMGSGLLPQPPLLGFLVLQRIVSVVLCG